jgi:hypothetical protein
MMTEALQHNKQRNTTILQAKEDRNTVTSNGEGMQEHRITVSNGKSTSSKGGQEHNITESKRTQL